MTSGAVKRQPITLRKATSADLDAVKALFDRHKLELGFIIRAALEKSIQQAELIIAVTHDEELAGLVHYHHRRDAQTTLYSIVVDSPWRERGVGRCLIDALRDECRIRKQHFILLKCPQGLPANDFYAHYGFNLAKKEIGKHRPLNVWTLCVI